MGCPCLAPNSCPRGPRLWVPRAGPAGAPDRPFPLRLSFRSPAMRQPRTGSPIPRSLLIGSLYRWWSTWHSVLPSAASCYVAALTGRSVCAYGRVPGAVPGLPVKPTRCPPARPRKGRSVTAAASRRRAARPPFAPPPPAAPPLPWLNFASNTSRGDSSRKPLMSAIPCRPNDPRAPSNEPDHVEPVGEDGGLAARQPAPSVRVVAHAAGVRTSVDSTPGASVDRARYTSATV